MTKMFCAGTHGTHSGKCVSSETFQNVNFSLEWGAPHSRNNLIIASCCSMKSPFCGGYKG